VVEFIGVPTHHAVAREIHENVVTVIALVVATGISYAQKATTKDQLFGT
jgi:hypothetical protein